MPSQKSSTIDTGLPALPEATDRSLFYELTKVYNAIGIIQQTLDTYTSGGTLAADIATIEANITTINTSINTINTNITAINTHLTSLDTSITGINSSIATINTTLGTKANSADVMLKADPRVVTGANKRMNFVVLVGGVAVVANTSVTLNSTIFLTSNADFGTPGFLRVSNRVIGTSFTIQSSNSLDTSVVAYVIFEPV